MFLSLKPAETLKLNISSAYQSSLFATRGPVNMQHDHFDVVSSLGSGSYGTVSKIKHKRDNKIMVWKEINFGKMNEKEKTQLVAEVNILRDLKNPFIVEFYDRILDKPNTRLFIVMEHCAGGDLGKIIERCNRNKTNLDEQLIWKIFAQSLLALKECHRRKENGEFKPIIHRDIKPANILLDANQNIKMGDFGLAKELSSRSKLAQTNVGTPYYMAPEIINEKDYDEKSDIWSLGCVLYELAALRPPFNATNAVSLAVKINAGSFARLPAKYSESLNTAIRTMIQVNPRSRPRVEDLEALPAIQPAITAARMVVREYRFDQRCIDQIKDLKGREDRVAAREEKVAARETQLSKYESTLKQKEIQLTQWADALKQAASDSNAKMAQQQQTQQPVPQVHTRRSRLSMDRVTQSMCVDDEDDVPSYPPPEGPPAHSVDHSVPPPPSTGGPVPVPNNSNKPSFEIYMDKPAKMDPPMCRPSSLFNMRNAPPPPISNSIFSKMPPPPAPVSNFTRNQRRGPIVTGAELAKENVFPAEMLPPSSSAVSSSAVTTATSTATSTAQQQQQQQVAPQHAQRRPMQYDASVENSVGSPWKKQKGADGGTTAAAAIGEQQIRRPLQARPNSHVALNINQAPQANNFSDVFKTAVNRAPGAPSALSKQQQYERYPANVQVDLKTLLRQQQQHTNNSGVI